MPQSPGATDAGDADQLQPISRADQRWQHHAAHVTQPTSSAQLAVRTEPAELQRSLNLTGAAPPFRPFPEFGRAMGALNSAVTLPQPPRQQPIGPLPVDEPSQIPGRLIHNEQSAGSDWNDGSELLQTADASEQAQSRTTNEIARFDTAHARGPIASHMGMQIHNRYLVTQDECGMIVVDQHALHERILYEQLRSKISSGKVESQQLLVPEPVDLPPSEMAAAIESRELLAQIGIGVEPFGGDTILMTSYPAMLANMRPAELLRQVIEPLMSGGKEPSARDLLDDLLHMIACKAAIKAGDKLAPEEITALLEQRYHYQDTHHCPHGRPTALFFSREQLDKMFKRT